MSRKLRRVRNRFVFAALAMAAFLAPASAQQRQSIRTVSLYRVKPDRIPDFQGAAKEFKAVLEKGGSDHSFTVWLSLTGPREYAKVDHYSKWADLDVTQDPKLKEQAADLQRINTRIIQCLESYQRIVEEVLPDLSLPPSKEVPNLIRTLRSRIRPDKINDYLALVKSEILPAARKSGVKDYSIAQVRYGAPTSEFLTAIGFNKWADLDEPFGVQKAMGEEGYQRFLSRIRPLLLESEYNVYRLQRDLSYLPASSGSGAGN